MLLWKNLRMALNKTPELSSLVSAADEGGLEEIFSDFEEFLLRLFTVTVLSSCLSSKILTYQFSNVRWY